MKCLAILISAALTGCQTPKNNKWIQINISQIPKSSISVVNDSDGWLVENARGQSVNDVISMIEKRNEKNVFIKLRKDASYKENDFEYLAETLNSRFHRRVFYHQDRGSIDSIEVAFEFKK